MTSKMCFSRSQTGGISESPNSWGNPVTKQFRTHQRFLALFFRDLIPFNPMKFIYKRQNKKSLKFDKFPKPPLKFTALYTCTLTMCK